MGNPEKVALVIIEIIRIEGTKGPAAGCLGCQTNTIQTFLGDGIQDHKCVLILSIS
jgi:hypothetical protein